MTYKEFIQSKTHLSGSFGFDPVYMPELAFDHQKHGIRESVIKGRYANFYDTGLGKTLMQLAIARNIVEKTNKRVLILAPLAVGFQFIKDAHDLSITDDISQTKKGELSSKIIVCNYDRIHFLDPSDYVCVILDESSILKNFKGEIRSKIIAFAKKMKYRFAFTATPSPNDYIELGNTSEFLGHMGYMDMLSKYFSNNNNTADSNARFGNKFYLKPHAEQAFFSWVNSWSTMCRMPSDLGFSNDGYILPELILNNHIVRNTSTIDIGGQVQMFTPVAKNFSEIRHEQKMTVSQRCDKAIELASGKTSVYWVNTNNESQIIASQDKEAKEIIGSQSIEQKEELLIAFTKGEIKRLVTKAKMTSMGLNWQHCNHTVFFPTHSYEQFYQAIRRFWRFGQQWPVTADLVLSDGLTKVLQTLQMKQAKADELYNNLIASTAKHKNTDNVTTQTFSKPNFL